MLGRFFFLFSKVQLHSFGYNKNSLPHGFGKNASVDFLIYSVFFTSPETLVKNFTWINSH